MEQDRVSPLLVHQPELGRPLISFEAVVNLIGSTTTRGGLKVKALLDTTSYEPGQKIPDADMRALRLKPHTFHGDWNYTLEPRPSTS